MYTARQLRDDLRNNKFIVIVVAVTGECNLHCEFCAYGSIKRHKKMTYETVAQIFDEIDRCPEEQNFLICWSGGEPTFDMDHLLKCQKIMLNRNYRNGKIKQAMMTNCWWANDDTVVKQIKSMHLDIIGVSGSECHIQEVPAKNMSKIIDMFDNSETTVWAYFNGKCYDLYTESYEKINKDNIFRHTIRKPNWTIHDCVRKLKYTEPYDLYVNKEPIGFYIHPNGVIGSSCSEEGNCPCVLGNVAIEGSLQKAIDKLHNAKTKNVLIKNCTIENGPELKHHLCRFCKEAGLDVSCFTERDGVLEVEFNDLITNTPVPETFAGKY